MKTFYFEMTDLFSEEMNYTWLKNFTINANSLRGALIKLSRETGFNFRYNEGKQYYKVRNALIAAYELEYKPDQYWLDTAKIL